MPFTAAPKYPSRRAYVVKLRSDATPLALAGRIENLVTGRQREFRTGTDLLDCIARDVPEHLSDPPDETTGEER